MHALRVTSLANGVSGTLSAAVVNIHAIGQAYAAVAEIDPRSGVKQVDRLLSNEGLSLDVIFSRWVPYALGDRKDVVLIVDWTDFDDDDHTTLYVMAATGRGRALPLAWRTIRKSESAGKKSKTERELIEALQGWMPKGVEVVLLGDRGFGSQALYQLLSLYGWDYVIRFRGDILVESGGQRKKAKHWVPSSGRPTMLRDVCVTGDKTPIPAAVLVHDKKMKEAWCLATSLRERTASEIVKLYAQRATIEASFRDAKDLHFGLGLSATHVRNAERRDRLLLLVAIAVTLLSLLGAACEEVGLDKKLKVNTVAKRTHSLFRQGSYWYSRIPTMRDEWLRPLMEAFDRLLRADAFFGPLLLTSRPKQGDA
jgi:hypothetical protein